MSNKNILTKNKHNLLLITHLKHLIHNCLHLVYGGKQKVKKKKNKYNSRKDKMKKARSKGQCLHYPSLIEVGTAPKKMHLIPQSTNPTRLKLTSFRIQGILSGK